MKKSLLFVCFLVLITASVQASVILHSDYKRQSFYDQTVKITNADDMAFTNIYYDHSQWADITIPSTWTKEVFPRYEGVAWYRISMVFPDSVPPYTLGLNLGKISDADEAYFNGTKIGGMGSFNDLNHISYDVIRIYEIPSRLILTGRTNILAIRVKGIFDDEGGLISGPFVLDTFHVLEKQIYYEDLGRICFIVAYMVIGLYFILLFLRQRQNKEYLQFGILCIILTLYFFLRTQLKIDLGIDHLLLKKIEYLSLTVVFPLFLWFIFSLFKVRKLRWFLYSLTAIYAAGFLTILFSSTPQTWNFINTRILQYVWLIETTGIIALLISLYKQEKDARVMVYSFIVFSVSIIIDILAVRSILILPFISSIGLLAPYGFAAFIFSIALVLSDNFVRLHKEVEASKAELLSTLKQIDEAYAEVDKAYLEAMNRLAIIAEMRDSETGTHIHRVSHYVRVLAEKAGFSPEAVTNMFYAAPMHDVGKVGIPDHILFKQGPLSKEEWDVMKTHTEIGARIFDDAQSAILKVAREITLSHHEKWSGGGYPRGISGTDIPVSGRMMALADVYDALRSKRPYKPAFSHKQAVEIIAHGDDRLNPDDFDPELLKIFLENEKIFNAIFENNSDSEDESA